MQIKYQELERHLKQNMLSFYCLAGVDAFVMNNARDKIISTFKKKGSCDHIHALPSTASDWHQSIQETTNGGLFNELIIVDILHAKSSFDKEIKAMIEAWLNKPPANSLIVLRAPNLAAKDFKWLDKSEHGLLIPCYSLSKQEHLRWLADALAKNALKVPEDMHQQILHYTDGNMLATTQLVERLAMCYPDGGSLTHQQVLEQLFMQNEHQLYDLNDAYLSGQTERALKIVRRMQQTGDQKLLILWLITQDVYLFIRLHHLTQSMSFAEAARQCGIFSQKQAAWQKAIKRLTPDNAKMLLRKCHELDVLIKSSPAFLSDIALERLICHLAEGRALEAL